MLSVPGLLISMCLPVAYKKKLKGVACVDLSMNYIMQDFTYFQESEATYAFIINDQTRVMSHPLLQPPAEISNNPNFIFLSTLEPTLSDEMIAEINKY